MTGLSQEINRMLDTIEKTQKKLQESEEQIREVVENIPDYVVIYGDGGEILYVNPAGMEATGYPEDEIIGKPIFTLSTDDSREILIHAMEIRQKGQPVPPYEIGVKTKTGRIRTVLVTLQCQVQKRISTIISFDLYISKYNIFAVLIGHSRMRSHDLESR
jgi:PAS domain S-box-containing protein